MTRPSFLSRSPSPQLVTIITDTHPDDAIATMRNAAYDGTDGYGFMLDVLDRQYHTRADFDRMFAYAADRPILTMNYRTSNNRGISDEGLVSGQLMAIEAGATMVDLIGDTFDPSPMELSTRPDIVERQRQLVEEVHSKGGEVLMSSHTWEFMNADQTIEHFQQLESRGADMVKVAMCAHDEDQLIEAIRTTFLVNRALTKPFVHVCMGQYGKIHRVISAMSGSALTLCVQQYTARGHNEQPLLRATKAVFDNLDHRMARNDQLGTTKPARVD